MGIVSQIFGSSGGGASSATIVNPVEKAQADSQLNLVNSAQNQQQNFLNQLQAQSGTSSQNSFLAQQQGLANQLQQQANGQGPNPAQDMLAQNTAANTANQAALMGGQRGVGDNAGLLARQAANVGAQNQQQQVGQAATMGAQQQLAAQQQLGQQQMNMQQVAGSQIANQAQATQGLNQNAQSLYNQQLSAINAGNQARVGNNASQNTYNGAIAQQQNAFGQQLIGGALSGAASGLTGMAGKLGGGAMATGGATSMAHGGMAGYADGGTVIKPDPAAAVAGATVKAASGANIMHPSTWFAGGGVVDALVAHKNFKAGGPVPGQAKVAGDSYANDNVKAVLSPGEIVIPRHITQGANPAEAAAKFVQAILARKGAPK